MALTGSLQILIIFDYKCFKTLHSYEKTLWNGYWTKHRNKCSVYFTLRPTGKSYVFPVTRPTLNIFFHYIFSLKLHFSHLFKLKNCLLVGVFDFFFRCITIIKYIAWKYSNRRTLNGYFLIPTKKNSDPIFGGLICYRKHIIFLSGLIPSHRSNSDVQYLHCQQKFLQGVYENFWTVGGGSMKYSSKKRGGLGKKFQFLKISIYPPDNKWKVPKTNFLTICYTIRRPMVGRNSIYSIW